MTVLSLLGGGSPSPQSQQAPARKPPSDDPMAKLVATVLADTEDARELHAWQQRTTPALVRQGAEKWQRQGLRYLFCQAIVIYGG